MNDPLIEALQADPEHAALRALSAREGGDPSRVQGAGGNTSLKLGDTLWIKASGIWLAEALERDLFVPVRLGALREALARDDPASETSRDFVIDTANPDGLRPSIETTVHALLPQRVVVHVHCVETIAQAVIADAEATLATALDGLAWAWVPYARPGLPLARAIERARDASTDVLVLGNHGLVVAADTVADARALLERVCDRLALPRRAIGSPDLPALSALARNGDYTLPADPHCHDVALESTALAFATGGSPYPDHVIFLGAGNCIATGDADVAATLASHGADEAPPAILFPGRGALVRRDAARGVEPMLRCLGDVALRVPAGAAVRVLSADEEHELLNWEAEAYRQRLARTVAAPARGP